MWILLLALVLSLLFSAEVFSLLTMKYGESSPLAAKWYKDKQRSLTRKQKQVLRTNGPGYIIPLKYNETIALPVNTDLDIEIGCGSGDFLVDLCKNNKDRRIIGCDIHRSSIATSLSKIMTFNVTNCNLVRSDALYFLDNLPNNSINNVYILFPDPWSREKDHKKRIVRKDIIDLLLLKMKPLSILTIATDDECYHDHITNIMSSYCDCYSLLDYYTHPPGLNLPVWREGVIGKYEQKAVESNAHLVYNYRYVLVRK